MASTSDAHHNPIARRFLRHARHAKRLTQRQLAALTTVHQPTIAGIESGAHDPSVSRLAELIRATGHQLALLPTTTPTVADTAEAIFEALRRRDDEVTAWRHIIALNDDLRSEHGAVRVALTVTPPASVGDRRYDAAIAGLVDYLLAEEHLPVPEWVNNATRFLSDPWVVDPFAGPEIGKRTPNSFRRRGVLVDAAEFESV